MTNVVASMSVAIATLMDIALVQMRRVASASKHPSNQARHPPFPLLQVKNPVFLQAKNPLFLQAKNPRFCPHSLPPKHLPCQWMMTCLQSAMNFSRSSTRLQKVGQPPSGRVEWLAKFALPKGHSCMPSSGMLPLQSQKLPHSRTKHGNESRNPMTMKCPSGQLLVASLSSGVLFRGMGKVVDLIPQASSSNAKTPPPQVAHSLLQPLLLMLIEHPIL